MSIERRKCLIKKEYGQPTEGYFEMYGNTAFCDDSGNQFPVTVAIIEKTDGEVIKVNPSLVTFVK